MKYLFVMLFVGLFFVVADSGVSAQSCTGVITCCNTMGNIYSPSGCSTSCDPSSNPNCTPCVGPPVWGCTSTGTVQSCYNHTLPSGAISCAVDSTCNFGSVGVCTGGAPPPNTSTPRPTTTTMPLTPTSTPAAPPPPPNNCTQGNQVAWPTCSGTDNQCGTWSGGVCCCPNPVGFSCVEPGVVAQSGTPKACGYRCPGYTGQCPVSCSGLSGAAADSCFYSGYTDCCEGTNRPWIVGLIYNSITSQYEGYYSTQPGQGNYIDVVGTGERASYLTSTQGEVYYSVAKAAPPLWRMSNMTSVDSNPAVVGPNPTTWDNTGELVSVRFTPRPGYTCGTWRVYYFDWNTATDNVWGPSGTGCVATIRMQNGTDHPRFHAHNRVDFTMTNASCTTSFVNPPATLVRNAPPVNFGLQVNPVGQPATSARVDVVSGNGVVITGPQPAGPWGVPTALTFAASAPFNSAPAVSLRGVVEMRDASNTLLAQCSTTDVNVEVKNPNTTFFLAGGGGDVIAAGQNSSIVSNLANPLATSVAGYYFSHNPKPAVGDIKDLGIAFGVTFAPPLDSSNVNSKGWLVTLPSAGYQTLVTKRENTYAGIRDRIEAQLVVPMATANTMTQVSQIANSACTPTTSCVAGVHIVKYGGGTLAGSTSQPERTQIDIGTGKVILFADNGGVTTIQSPIVVSGGGFFALFVQGSITIAQEVGQGSLTGSTTGNIDITAVNHPADLYGIYFAGGDINFGTSANSGLFGCTPVPTPLPPAIYNPNSPQCWRQIRINGSVIAMGEVNLNRKHLGDRPTEYVHFVPDYAYQLYLVGTRQKKYQELLAP